MQAVIIQMVILLHVVFGCMFLFLSRQHPTKFSRLIALSWLLEAFRAGIILAESGNLGVWFNHWYSFSDCLSVFATWWLFAGCADLAEVRLPARLGRWFIGVSIPVILALRYLAPWALRAGFGLSLERAGNLSVLAELVFIFVPVTIARVAILFWFIDIWRKTRLPGAVLAIIFGVPYIVFALAVPIQFYLKYYPEWIYFAWAARVLGFSAGLVMLFFDKQLAEQREREKGYRTIVETSHDLIWSVDAQGCWTFVNGAARGIYGFEPAEMLGRPFTDFESPEQARKDLETFARIKAGTPVFNYETVHNRKNGTPVSLSFNAVIMRDEQGTVVGTTGTAQDITQRKKAEENVRHLAAFPELNPNPVLEFRDDGSLAYQNPAALAMVRKTGHTDMGQLLPDNTKAIVMQCLATGQPRLRLVTTHGGHSLSWSFYPIIVQRVVHCYVGDITDRQLLEEQLRQAQKMEAIGQLAGGVAHDFNNLLTAIIGHLGLLKTNPQVTGAMADSLNEIGAAANRAANLTNQLLAFSRRQVISIRALDLSEIAANLVKMLRRLLGEDIAIKLDFAPERLVFDGDAGMMEQVLINLAVNARDAMPGGGTLRIATGSETRVGRNSEALAGGMEPADFVYLAVSDSGVGIPAEHLPRIFEPFFTTKEVGKGTGLGLATVFGIVQQHRGWIEVESEPGRGTAFRIYLPRLAATPLNEAEVRPIEPGRGHGELILLVEDDPAVRDMGTVALKRQGYRVLTAASGQAAMEVWAAQKAEIVLLLTDVIMPGGVSGLQLAQQFLQEKPELRVIYSSGYSKEIASKNLAMKEGINFLAKPYEIERLYCAVRNALDGKMSRPPFALI